MAKKLIGAGLLIFLSIHLQGCLKTRAQLRSESSADNLYGARDEGDERSDRDSSRGPSSAPPLREVKPQGGYVIDEVKDEITRLSGRIEDLERQQKELDKNSDHQKADESFRKLEARLLSLEKTQQTLQEAFNQLQDSALAHQDPEEMMKMAKASFNEGRYEDVTEQLAKYQKVPKAKNLDEAAFLRGESFFHLKQFKKAVVEYSKFPEKFSHSAHYPEALFKIGLSFDSMGMKEDAQGFYQELIEKFPRSLQAKKARKKAK